MRDKSVTWQVSAADCNKNNHDEYQTLSDVEQTTWDDSEKLGLLTQMYHLTVCVKNDVTPDQVCHGSGFVQRVRTTTGQNCPDRTCEMRGKENHTWGVMTITTVNHVINCLGLAGKAENLTAKLHYDHEYDVCEILSGFRLIDSDKDIGDYDWCAFECHSHNFRLVTDLEECLKEYEKLQSKLYNRYKDRVGEIPVFIVGHPHGGPKKISLGTVHREREILKEVRERQEWCRYFYTNATCSGSSGSPIYMLGQRLCGYGYWFGHPHNHSGYLQKVACGCSSIGVDHYDGSMVAESGDVGAGGTGTHDTEINGTDTNDTNTHGTETNDTESI